MNKKTLLRKIDLTLKQYGIDLKKLFKAIFQNKPEKHIDIGSRVDGFVAHLASFREVFVFDIRNIESKVKNIHFVQADLMRFDENLTESTDSISCLHALEHFGLGRYGDEIYYWAYLKGFNHFHE